MLRCCRGPFWFVISSLSLLTLLAGAPFGAEPALAASPSSASAGSLEILGKDGSIRGSCPLKLTEVRGAISGFLARVTVAQIFENSAPTPIEAVGRGDSEIVTLNDKADAAAHRLYERLRSPLLTDLSIDWHGLPVTEEYPQRLPDLFDGKPLMVTGRYMAPAAGNIRLTGKRAGEDFVREIPIALATISSQHDSQHDVLAGFWARRKIDELLSPDWVECRAGM